MRTRSKTSGFSGDPDDPGPLARILERMPIGATVVIGKATIDDEPHLTVYRHIPGRGTVYGVPLRLRSDDGEPIPAQTALAHIALYIDRVDVGPERSTG